MSDRPLDPAAAAERLARTDAYPDDASAARGVECIQTHLSWVFLTADRVYKLRKPVDLGFVCFATRALRNGDCVREVELNRRLSPDVYLGIAPVGADGLGSAGEELRDGYEHCVVMRRLPPGGDALSLLDADRLGPERLEAIAKTIAAFHARVGLGTPAPWSPEAWRARITRPVHENFEALRASARDCALPADVLDTAERRAQRFESESAAALERRREEGRAVDGHGDLHLQHFWFEEAAPLVIDCLEFSDELRRGDAAADVAFLAMDLVYRGHAPKAERFLRAYARDSDDFGLYDVVDYYVAYRAAVRAKVAALAAADRDIDSGQRQNAEGSARRHLELAGRALERDRGALVITSGLVGTGKSSVADALADAMDGVPVSSDRVRKGLAGLDAAARAGADWEAGIYSPDMTRRVYAGLIERARPIVRSGRVAILDATWSRREQRAQALDAAAELGVPARLVWVRCDRDTVLDRIARRASRGTDPSDAGPAEFARSEAGYETPDEWPAALRAVVRTDADDWRSGLAELAASIRAASRSDGRSS